MRAFVWGEDGLVDAEVVEEFHLFEAGEGGASGVGEMFAVEHRRQVAVRQAAVVVGGASEAVEVHFIDDGGVVAAAIHGYQRG